MEALQDRAHTMLKVCWRSDDNTESLWLAWRRSDHHGLMCYWRALWFARSAQARWYV